MISGLSQSSRHRCRASRAFTLVELLVAVSILSVLLALLVASFQGIFKVNDLTQSMNALRQIQTANQAYAAENRGWYVPILERDDNGVLTRWVDNRGLLEKLGIEKGSPWPDSLISPRAGLLDSSGRPRYDRSWGMNKEGFTGYSTKGNKWQAHAGRLQRPSETIAIADGLDWIISSHSADEYAGEEVYIHNGIAYRYDGRATVVFYDGHVRAMTMEEILAEPELWDFQK